MVVEKLEHIVQDSTRNIFLRIGCLLLDHLAFLGCIALLILGLGCVFGIMALFLFFWTIGNGWLSLVLTLALSGLISYVYLKGIEKEWWNEL